MTSQTDPITPQAPVMTILPKGLIISGITTWAGRLSREFSDHGHACAILAHAESANHGAVPHLVDDRVRMIRPPGLFDPDERPGDYESLIPAYRDAIRALSEESGQPVVVIPTLSAECFGILSALSMTDPESLRVIGWQHNHVAYDARTMVNFEPLISQYVGVSTAIVSRLCESLPGRVTDISHIPYGVDVPEAPPARAPWRDRPLRLVYTGRLDRNQKRIDALPLLSERLNRVGLDHEMLVIGDGPAHADALHWADSNPSIRLHTAAGPASEHAVARALSDADCFILPSRFEGLSVSMLEAMARGCVPIVTHVESGAADAIAHRESGVLIQASPADEPELVADRMARAIADISPDQLVRMAEQAWLAARERYSLKLHIQRARSVIQTTAASGPRRWPATRPCAPGHSESSATGMTVPKDAASQMQQTLRSITQSPDARIAIWGTGEHTVALARVLALYSSHVVCMLDDDPARCGSRLWGLSILPPKDASAARITDVVISSWLHEQDMWARRGSLESAGIRVHRLYAAESLGRLAAV